MRAPRKPQVPTSAPLDERIARIKSRSAPKGFLDAAPIETPATLTQILAKRTAKVDAEWDRRKQQHLEFLETTESLGIAEAFYQIRSYIRDEPYICVGVWEDEWTADDGQVIPAGWSPIGIPDWSDCGPKYQAAVAEVRTHLIEVFREVLGDAVCPDGVPWEQWKRIFRWDQGNATGCAKCDAQYKLALAGRNPELANFPDAKVMKNGNTRSANTILSVLGLSRWNETDRRYETAASNEKLAQIDAAVQRDALTGGKRVRPRGIGADSSDRIGDDKSAGSQDNSTRGRGDAELPGEKNKLDERKHEQLPAFDSIPETLDGKKLKEHIAQSAVEEIEVDEETYDPKEDQDLKQEDEDEQ